MALCHHFAKQALNILRYLARNWDIKFKFKSNGLLGYSYDQLVHPYIGSLNFFANVGIKDFICNWGLGNCTISESQLLESAAGDAKQRGLCCRQGRQRNDPALPCDPL